MKLYNFFRSGASYRVRIALNLKGLSYEWASVNLLKDGGAHRLPAYRAVNPQMRIPALALSGGEVLVQSLAIIEYLDEVYPDPPLLPTEAAARAKARGIALIVAADIHQVVNSGTLKYLRETMGQNEAVIDTWYAHWIEEGFSAIEQMIAPAPYTMGSQVTIADLCLVPQIQSALRANVRMDRFPKIMAIEAACRKLPAFEQARPEHQPDAE